MRVALAAYAGPTRFFDLLIPDRGLAALAAVLESQNVDFKVFDLNRLDYSCGEFLRELRSFRPDVVGFKFFDSGFVAVDLLAAQVRREHPRAVIAAGGPHATLFQEHIMCASSAFDVVVYGEGERALVDLLAAVASGRGFADVPGAIFRGSRGEVVKTPQVLCDDLDSLPFPRWEVFELEKYLPIALLNAYRGCPFTCAFCAHNRTWGYHETEHSYEPIVRRRSLPSLRREIEATLASGMRLFGFTDSTPLPPLWRELARTFLELDDRIRWTSFAYVGHFDDADFKLLARSGCAALWYGVESGSPELRSRMGKHFTNQDVLQTFAKARANGIIAIPGFIVGFPGETTESVRATMELRRALDVPVSVLSPFILDPGTPVSLSPDSFGVRVEPHWEDKIVKRLGVNEFEIPYFFVDGSSNVDLWRKHALLCDYPGYEQDRNIAESEYAYLLARATDIPAGEVLRSLDVLVKTLDVSGLHRYLADIWRRCST